jgi:hypothetical protein
LVSWWKLDNTTTGIEDSKGSNDGTNNGATEMYGSVSTLNGESIGMSQSNLVQSDLQTVAPYSKYALSFDGNDYIDCGNDSVFQFQAADSFSVSAWLNINSVTGNADFIVSNGLWNTSPYSGWGLNLQGANILRFDLTDNNLANQLSIDSSGITLNTNTWYHVLFTYDGSNSTTGMNFYLDGSLTSKTIVANNALGVITYTSSMKLNIGARESGVRPFNGDISNVSIFDSALTQAQVREIYNQGLPSNLHNFSGTAPVAWWQLGENSSFNGNDWICADEIGSNNGESDGMGVDALTNGVGTTANGSSTGMSEGSLVGNAPYSVASTVSRNVAVQEFDPLAPSTVISGRSEDVPS